MPNVPQGEPDRDAMQRPHDDIRPIPDPTVLTNRLVAQAEQRFDQKLVALEALIQSKLDAVIQLTTEKFTTVDCEFHRVEATRIEQKQDTAANIAAALLAQKEASTNNDLAVKEQLTQLRTASIASETNLRLAIDGVKEGARKDIETFREIAMNSINTASTRLTAVEQQKVGAKDNSLLIGGGVTVILLILALMGWIASHNTPTITTQPAPQPQIIYPPPAPAAAEK